MEFRIVFYKNNLGNSPIEEFLLELSNRNLVMRRQKDDLDRLTEKLIKQDSSFKQELENAGQAWDIAFQIYDLRKKAGFTQTELAKLVGTKQANIARIESADYTGYTFKTLEKVTKALKAKLEIRIISPSSSKRSIHAQ